VAGTLEFADVLHLTATFTPAEPLAPGVDHTLLITQAIEDLDGDALDAAAAIEFTTESGQTSSGLQLVVVSGNDQKGKAGAPLAEPLVVRVTDSRGGPVADVEVAWQSDGALNGQFDPDANISSQISTQTDGDGLTEVTLTPMMFAPIFANARLPGDDGSFVRFSADARDPGATLAIVSGNHQQARTGYELAEPLVVRVTNGDGIPVSDLPVRWTNGSGQLHLVGDDNGVGSVHTFTDSAGLAQASIMPVWFGPVEVIAGVTGVTAQIFVADATDPGVTVTMVAGDGQEGKAGEPLSEPLVVRVTDSQGRPVPNARFSWSGYGWFLDQTTSDEDGLARASFSAWDVGTFTVSTRPSGIGINSRVDFTADVTVLVIALPVPTSGFNGFAGPYCEPWFTCGDWSVPIGTPVEWVNQRPTARIASASVPVGGASFDSGFLGENERFQFVPSVAGTWEYSDLVSGVTGTLTAY
jgi:protocatechuate 3,4-dioxygenase beta subunit